MSRKKILFFGAGVLGSLYAARVQEAGHEVALVARGARYRDIETHGVVLQDFGTGERTTTRVPVFEGMPTDAYYDACVVLVRKEQLGSALTELAKNPHIPTFVVMTNTAEDPEAIAAVLGRDRLVLGHANAGGEREGHVVHYMISQEITLGELDGGPSERLQSLAEVFRSAGFPVVFSEDIVAWKKYHVALAVPFSYALYEEGTCNYALAASRAGMKRCIGGLREAYRVLKDLGYPVEPPQLRWIMWMPDFLLIPLFRRVLNTKIADIGMARHARNAREEMESLAREFSALKAESTVATPVLDDLIGSADHPRMEAGNA